MSNFRKSVYPKMNSFIKRSLTGIIYVGVIVASVLLTDWAFPVVCTLFGLLGLVEFDKLSRNVGSVSGHAFAIDFIFAALMLVAPVFGIDAMLTFAFLVPYVLVRLAAQLYFRSETPVTDTAKSCLYFGWIAVPLVMLEALWQMSHELVLVMFVMIWLNDTGAYCVGSAIGRNRLFERISPKKSWEGFFGGLLFSAVFGWFMPDLLDLCGMSRICTPTSGALMGVTVSIASTFGDLVESMFKRALHVKDSGTIMPGHGGILDRIDSLLFVAPVMFLALLLWLTTSLPLTNL